MFLYSCKKENEQGERKKNGNCFLTESSITAPDGNAEAIYSYDNTGRVTKIQGGVMAANYAYSSNQIIEIRNRNSFTYKLDASGKIISSINSGSDYKDEYEYLYNSEGYIIETKIKRFYDTEYRTYEKYSYTNGNLTSFFNSLSNSNSIITYSSELSSDNFFIDPELSRFPRFYNHPLQGYFGKQSKNLASKLSYHEVHSQSYIYQKDTKGNITQVSISYSQGGGVIFNNKYICK